MKSYRTLTFTPCGGGREIGANSYVVQLNGFHVLLDCGVHPKKEGLGSLPNFSVLTRAPDAAIISHGHVDHCGAVPELLKHFPGVPTLAKERGITEYPLYQHEDVNYTIKRTCGVPLGDEFALDDHGNVTVELLHAGHVLGSASILIRTPDHNVLYTGDICTSDQELMAGMAPLDNDLSIDTLIIESTYGANHLADKTSVEEQTERFAGSIRHVIERGGCVLVPCFALGRTQEMLNIIARLQETGDIPKVPVLASGLGRALYEVYNRYPDYLHPNANLRPLNRFGRVGDVWDRGVVHNILSRPCIVVATSGMMIENTPSALLAEEMVRSHLHGIFFVGYLDPDTLGYKLLHEEPGAAFAFGLGRPKVKVVLEDIDWFHFSAHAPRQALRDVVERIRPKNVIYVHGDPEAIDWMYQQSGNQSRTFSATIGQTVTCEA
ncbi:MAG: MBL fold metallo-hydrolase [Candidatus Hydrogenedentes bacterium]|nr:MBL fold metallo-hydrolase [Candidatus Hydrogenedentota bacterium]